MADPPRDTIRPRPSLGLAGCFTQIVGLIAAAVSIPLFIGPLGLWGLIVPVALVAGAWHYGTRSRRRYECAQCSYPLPSADVQRCPGCDAPLA